MPTNSKIDGESDVLAAISEMSEVDRKIGERLHEIIKTNAPELVPRTWYGMPAYSKDGKIVVFFRNRDKFKERYLLLGFNDAAKLDDGDMWPTNFAILELTEASEKRIAELVKKAVS